MKKKFHTHREENQKNQGFFSSDSHTQTERKRRRKKLNRLVSFNVDATVMQSLFHLLKGFRRLKLHPATVSFVPKTDYGVYVFYIHQHYAFTLANSLKLFILLYIQVFSLLFFTFKLPLIVGYNFFNTLNMSARSLIFFIKAPVILQ